MSPPIELPASAQRLVDLIGYDAAVTLIEMYGGTRIYIPKTPNGRLIELVGEEAAAALSRAFGGDPDVRIPLCPRLRQLAAVKLYREGWGAGRIARQLRTTEKSVYAWVKEADAQRYRGMNGDLFGEP
jgi:hypothetical protein